MGRQLDYCIIFNNAILPSSCLHYAQINPTCTNFLPRSVYQSKSRCNKVFRREIFSLVFFVGEIAGTLTHWLEYIDGTNRMLWEWDVVSLKDTLSTPSLFFRECFSMCEHTHTSTACVCVLVLYLNTLFSSCCPHCSGSLSAQPSQKSMQGRKK